MRIQLTPASNMRVHHQRSQGRNGSRGRSELMPNPFSICDDRFGGTRSGTCANKGIVNSSAAPFMSAVYWQNMMRYTELYIDGGWRRASGTIEVLSASTEEVIGSIPEGTAEDVDAAVDAARRAFPGWSETSPAERADWLDKIAGALKERTEQIARTIAMEGGSPISIATSIQAGLPVVVTSSYAKLLREVKFEQEIGNSLVVREAAGVVGAITPWNYPLHQIMAKVAPALAAGCTVVLKPSELAPLNAMLLAEACIAIGLPAGVLNIVTGYGPVVGEVIASHAGVDMVSFTGSVRAGKRVASLAAQTIKRVTLELGGKSACVILDDAPFEKAV